MIADTVMSRMAEDFRKETERQDQRFALLLGTLLMGRSAPPGSQLLGKPIRITVEWPEGLPFGWSEEQLIAHGKDVFTKAGGVLPGG